VADELGTSPESKLWNCIDQYLVYNPVTGASLLDPNDLVFPFRGGADPHIARLAYREAVDDAGTVATDSTSWESAPGWSSGRHSLVTTERAGTRQATARRCCGSMWH